MTRFTLEGESIESELRRLWPVSSNDIVNARSADGTVPRGVPLFDGAVVAHADVTTRVEHAVDGLLIAH